MGQRENCLSSAAVHIFKAWQNNKEKSVSVDVDVGEGFAKMRYCIFQN